MDVCEEVSKKFITKLQSGAVLEASRLLDDQVLWNQPGRTELSGVHKGRPQVMALLAKFATKGIRIELQEAYRCDEEILCRVLIKHALGERTEFQLLTVKNGLIEQIKHHGDTQFFSDLLSFEPQRSRSLNKATQNSLGKS